MKKILVALVAVFVVVVVNQSILAEEADRPLDVSEIQTAIDVGLNKNSGDIGLYLDSASKGWDPFGMSIHVPKTWIQLQASMAVVDFRSFSVSDVTPDMTESVLRVFVTPSNVNRVLIRDTNEKETLEPLAISSCTQAIPFEFSVGNCKEFQFSLEDLDAIRNNDKKREFLVTVVVFGETRRSRRDVRIVKDFKVKTKHFDDLGWEE